jgi:hypothetical protein
MPLRWQTSFETPARSLEIPGEALVYTTYCGLLKQPDKQELASFCREIRKLLISNLLNDFRPPQETDRRARYFMTRWQSSLTTRRRAAYD